MRIIDLTMVVEEDLPSDPPMQIPRIRRLNHKDTARDMPTHFPGATVDDMPEGNGWAIDYLQICTHSGTHLDAPWHFYPTMNEDILDGGEKAWTIDQVPLDWCIGPGVKLDFRDRPDGYKITKADVQESLAKINYTLRPKDIVLVNTGADKRWGTLDYLKAGAGMSAEATLWMIEQGVKVVGTDGWSWDVPLPYEGEEFQRSGDPSILWEAHRVGRRRAYCHIEKLTNLECLPDFGYMVYALPIPIKGGSAGWSHVIAILDE